MDMLISFIFDINCAVNPFLQLFHEQLGNLLWTTQTILTYGQEHINILCYVLNVLIQQYKETINIYGSFLDHLLSFC